MSDNAEDSKTQSKTENESSTSLFGCAASSTPVRLFGQFKQNGSTFSGFAQTAPKEENSPTSKSYFTSAVSALSSSFGGGFASSSTPLAASLAPLSSNKELFSGPSKTSDEEKSEKEENNQEEKVEGENEESSSDESENKNQSSPSLLEKVAEYEAKRASTHPTAMIQGDTSTGEEEESTSFQMAGKLFMYSPEQQQYVERGYGVLKINEKNDPADENRLQARLIMRLDKAFRVILNSPIFPKMTVERASDRSVRFGAQDESQLRIFVIKASPNDCKKFCDELQSRIQIIESQTSTLPESQSPNKVGENCSPTTIRTRKRSHSRSDSETTDSNLDASKKSKLNEEKTNEKKEKNDGDEDSNDSVKPGEEETAN